MLMAFIAFIFSLMLAWLILQAFNHLADKRVSILWGYPLFWMSGIAFTIFTGLISGSYPALYLSSLEPVRVLKGVFKTGRLSAIPRKILVVVQFTFSIVLIIGTIIVFKQIEFAKNRPVGYSRDGLVYIEATNDDLDQHFNAARVDFLKTGHIAEVAESSSPTTGVNNDRDDLTWKGKDPAMSASFGYIAVTSGYGKTVGWDFKAGRDFNAQTVSDSFAIILNEAAIGFMGLSNPVGETVRIGKRNLTVIGIIKNMLMESPYDPIKPTIFHISPGPFDYFLIKINPNASPHEALHDIGAICKMYSPSVPFSYKFADETYAKKFFNEERIGKLAGFFAVLAVFISCLGLFGMASFMAEQRIREIGVRKVLGASVLNLWGQLSKDFVLLSIVSLFIAIPVGYTFMHHWLLQYVYRTDLPWWVFAVAGLGTVIITSLTVSYQCIKAALMNPVDSLRTM